MFVTTGGTACPLRSTHVRTAFAIPIFALVIVLGGCSANEPDIEVLLDAVDFGRAKEVREIVAANPEIVKSDAAVENDVLSIAIADCPEVVGLLLEKGADPNRVDSTGDAPLTVAIREGRIACVESLLKHGAEIDHGRDEPTYLDFTLWKIYYEDEHLEPLEKIRELLIEQGARKTAAVDLGLCPNGTALVDIPVVGEFDIDDDDVPQIERGELLAVKDGQFLETHPYSPKSQWHFSPMRRQWDKTAASSEGFQRKFPDVIANFDLPGNATALYRQILKGQDLVESHLQFQVSTLSYKQMVEHCRRVLRGSAIILPDTFADDGYATLRLSKNLELQVDAHPNEAEGAPIFYMEVTAASDID